MYQTSKVTHLSTFKNFKFVEKLLWQPGLTKNISGIPKWPRKMSVKINKQVILIVISRLNNMRIICYSRYFDLSLTLVWLWGFKILETLNMFTYF